MKIIILSDLLVVLFLASVRIELGGGGVGRGELWKAVECFGG
jgi:hypothetical protein